MTDKANRPLILASGSPRRRELLAKMGYEFEICAPDVDEHVGGNPRDIVVTLAQRQANAASEHCGRGVREAREMLAALSGREHEVFTGVCVLDADSGRYEVRCVRTGVTFREITPREIDDYIATGEPMDKAGAYAIQGGAGKFVCALDGELENVIGFPVVEVREILEHFL